jgi:signal transduction histidine kinase
MVGHLLPHAPPVIAERSRRTLEHALDTIVRSTDRMKRMVNDLLTSTRLEAGQLPIRKAPVEAARVLAQAQETLDAFACRHHVQVNLQVERGLPTLEGDEDRLVQVITNLLHNALKFSPEGGHVQLEASRVDGGVRFEVSDEGPGLTAEQQGHLFERFWQGHERAYVGAGLGLYISKGIVEAHGGRIDVASTPGHGTCFRVTFPVLQSVAGAPVAG